MQLAHIELWWLLPAIAPAVLLLFKSDRIQQRRLALFADAGLLPQLVTGFARIQRARRLEGYLLAAALLLAVLALLRPQWGFTWRPTEKRGVDLMVAVDVSESMLAEDIRPNRLTRARRELQDLLEGLQGDRVGLVSFAGSAFIECPLTLDYGAFRMFMSELDPELIPIKGTNVEAAILESITAFKRASGQAQEGATAALMRDRALLLITDGEDFDGNFETAAKLASDNKVRIYILGIGTAEGAPIPTARGYKKDRSGKVVITRLNQPALEELARKTGGVYVTSISSNRDIDTVYRYGIKEQLAGSSLEWARGRIWNEYFQLPLLLAVLCLIATEIIRLRSTRSPAAAESASVLEPGGAARQLLSALLVVLFSLAAEPAAAQTAEAKGARAKQAFERGDFSTALKEFSEAAAQKDHDYRFKIGQGATHYRLGEFAAALGSFFEAAKLTEEPAARAQALYNAGNSMVQLNQLQDAIKAYQQVLELTPEDREAKDNLEFAKKLLQQQKRQQQKNQDNQQKQQQQDEQQQSQEQQQDQQQDQQQQQQSGQNQEQQQEQSQTGRNDGPQEESPQSAGEEERDKEQQQQAGQQQQKNPGQEQSEENQQSQKQSSKDPQAQGEEKEQQQGKGSERRQQQAGGEQQGDEKRVPSDQLEAQLDTLQEGTSRRMKLRLQRGVAQLEELERKVPEKDW